MIDAGSAGILARLILIQSNSAVIRIANMRFEIRMLPTPTPSRPSGSGTSVDFVAHYSCGTVADFHRLPLNDDPRCQIVSGQITNQN